MIVDYNFILSNMVDDESLGAYPLDDCVYAEADGDFVREAMRRSAIEALDVLLNASIFVGTDKQFIQEVKSKL